MTRPRHGIGLLEVLVALPLMALLGAVAVQLLIGLHRQALLSDGALGASRELRHGAGVLAAELRVLRPADLVAWSDTAVEFDGLVGVGVVCASEIHSTRLAVMAVNTIAYAGDALATVWNQPPQAGDRIDIWYAGASVADSLFAATGVLRDASPSTACAQSPLLRVAGGPSLRLTLQDTTTGHVLTGSPVRVLRRTRYSVYRASDGDWYLGRRTRGPSGWDVIQPVAGPLHAARDRGLVIGIHDASGLRLDSTGASAAARVRVIMRAPRRAGRAAPRIVTTDSLLIDVALRAQHGSTR